MSEHFEVIIIGSGFGGMCCAIKLQEAGITNFLMLEKENDFGGTWYLNTYPGAAVDVQSYLYSYSFEPYDWSRIYAKQKEILAYTNHVLDHYNLKAHGRLNQEVVSAVFDEDQHKWAVKTKSGDQYSCHILINATGVLHTPLVPKIEGIQSFRGASFHSSQWDHSYDYKNKRVAVIGTGASGIQVIPAIAPDVSKLYVLQRTAHWILKRPDRPFKKFERSLLTKFPILAWLYREFLYWKNESRIVAFTSFPGLMKLFRYEGLYHIRKQVKNKELRKIITPNFTIGCKRILLSNEYYPALQQDHVELVTDSIQEINETGIMTSSGKQIDVDFIIYCTGFKAADYFPFELKGREGTEIHKVWQNGAHAYLGTTIPGFPNFFIMAGPNTGIGHTSALHIAESQVQYIMDAIKKMQNNHWKSVEIKENIEHSYNKKLQKAMSKTIWQTGGCKSWYQNAAGLNTTLYPASNVRFRRDTSRFKAMEYKLLK